MRLFVAVPLSLEAKELVGDLDRPDLASLRWTTEDQWHITLKFLGEVGSPAAVAEALKEVPGALREAGVGEIEITMGAATAWFRGRLILHVPVTGLDTLARVVAEVTGPFGEDSDDEPPFAGHLTLARVRRNGTGPANLAGSPISVEWTVSEILLMSSTLGPGGSRYAVVAQIPLGLPEPD